MKLEELYESYGMFDWEIVKIGLKVSFADGVYEDSEGYEIVVENGEIVEGGGYGLKLS